MDTIINFIRDIWNSLKAVIENKFWELIAKIADFIADLINMIPVPDFLNNVSGYISNIPPEVLFYMSAFKIPFGLTLISSAILFRFSLSLIPFVGSSFK